MPEGYRAEQTLLALLSTGKLPQDMVKEADFSHDVFREIVHRLNTGQTPADVISDPDLTDEIRQAAGETFSLLTDAEQENAAAIAADCLRTLQKQQLQQQIHEKTEWMRSANSPEEKAQALQEVQTLSKELARLKQQGR